MHVQGYGNWMWKFLQLPGSSSNELQQVTENDSSSDEANKKTAFLLLKVLSCFRVHWLRGLLKPRLIMRQEKLSLTLEIYCQNQMQQRVRENCTGIIHFWKWWSYIRKVPQGIERLPLFCWSWSPLIGFTIFMGGQERGRINSLFWRRSIPPSIPISCHSFAQLHSNVQQSPRRKLQTARVWNEENSRKWKKRNVNQRGYYLKQSGLSMN